ncbi:hypothetical protein LQZ18_13995 [Lachnospiraceae bacterium ZAX-1]
MIDSYMAFLAIIFFADLFYMEVSGKRAETFLLLPYEKQHQTLFKRLLISWVYLELVGNLAFVCFYLFYQPVSWNGGSLAIAYIQSLYASSASILFFGVLSFTLVNLFQQLWAGIGLGLALWFALNSSVGTRIPLWLNVLNSDVDASFWAVGKLFGILLVAFMLCINKKAFSEGREMKLEH